MIASHKVTNIGVLPWTGNYTQEYEIQQKTVIWIKTDICLVFEWPFELKLMFFFFTDTLNVVKKKMIIIIVCLNATT